MTTTSGAKAGTPAGETTLGELKRAASATWALGNYGEVAARELWPIGERIIRRLDVQPGEQILDVGCGTGNAAIRAALAGGRTVGLDLTPELLEDARVLAQRAGAEVEWREGDVEDLPFEDASFDVVVSTFGCMFAPRHEEAAREMARVLRPGGRMGLATWPPDGNLGQIMRTIAGYLPPPLPPAQPPLRWGDEGHVRDLFAGTGIELRFDRDAIAHEPFDTPEADVDFHATRFGPLMQAKARTESEGRWDQLRAELLPLHVDRRELEYVIILGTKQTQGGVER